MKIKKHGVSFIEAASIWRVMPSKMKDEYDLSALKKRKKTKSSKDLKVSKTIRLDLDVLEWLQESAENEGVGYQTFLNSFLKKAMREETPKLEDIINRLKKLEQKVG